MRFDLFVLTALPLVSCHEVLSPEMYHVYVQNSTKRRRFDGAGFSITGTKEVLSSIASDALVDDGDCVNAAEVFWTPSERSEVLTRNDIILDFPELVDM